MTLLDKTVKGMYQMSSGLKTQHSLLNVYNYHGFGRVLYNFDMIDHSKQKLNSKHTISIIKQDSLYQLVITHRIQ